MLGMNCNRDGIQAIKDGREYSTATQPPVRMGEKAADVVADYFDGKIPPKQVVLDVEAIDKNNIDKFAAGCTY